MRKALEGKPGIPFRTPEGIRLVRMDLETGQRAKPGSDKVILEAFKAGNGPGDEQVVIRGGVPSTAGTANSGTNGATGGDGNTGGNPSVGGPSVGGPSVGGPSVGGSSGLY
jgi:penicillin-binding protein 1A